MRKLLIALTLVFCASAGDVEAQKYWGSSFHRRCLLIKMDPIAADICRSYIEGVIATLVSPYGVKIENLCIPNLSKDSAKYKMMRAVERYFVDKNIIVYDLSAPEIIIRAIRATYPCK
jgi:hypothetical protein